MDFQNSMLREIVEELLQQRQVTRKTVERIAKKVCRKHSLKGIPTNIQILQVCTSEEREKLREFLVMKPVRTISGVAIITVVAKPAPCPGSCIYCYRGMNSPQSYTGLEPAIQRAIRNDYNPFLQVQNRLKQYHLMGHSRDKIEIIILGGTFLALEDEYQEWFVKRIFDALNGKESESLKKAQKLNESSLNRCIGLCVETRPDYCKEKHVNKLLELGATRVEIGVQTIYPDVLEIVNRGHSIEDSIEAIRIAKDSGFKVVVHIMPGLPDSNFERDFEMFRTLFSDQRFMPDDLKIYPTVVIKYSELYEIWKREEYKPLTDEQALNLLVEIKKIVPPWVRIRRAIRDTPATEIIAGPKKTNLRELAQWKIKNLGIRCRCTRCRELGHVKKLFDMEPKVENIKLVRREYDASEGKEIFLSFEDVKQDILIALLRLRIPSDKAHRTEINKLPSAIVREIHTYGPIVPIYKEPIREWQHRGYGRELLQEAEMLTKEFGKKKILIISGVGAKEYFLKQGYKYDGSYVSKPL